MNKNSEFLLLKIKSYFLYKCSFKCFMYCLSEKLYEKKSIDLKRFLSLFCFQILPFFRISFKTGYCPTVLLRQRYNSVIF